MTELSGRPSRSIHRLTLDFGLEASVVDNQNPDYSFARHLTFEFHHSWLEITDSKVAFPQ